MILLARNRDMSRAKARCIPRHLSQILKDLVFNDPQIRPFGDLSIEQDAGRSLRQKEMAGT